MIYFNLNSETIKENCRFKFYYNKTDIAATVLDVEMKSFWQTDPMISTLYATLTMTYQLRYPAHPYVLVNRSVLCNCGIEAENHFLLSLWLHVKV